MFLAAVLHSEPEREWVARAADLHAQKLATTGYFGTLKAITRPGFTLFWDGASTHAGVIESGGAVAVRGGYVAGPDELLLDPAATQDPDFWGEFAAIVFANKGDHGRVRAFSDPAGSWPLYVAQGSDDGPLAVSNDPHFAAIVTEHYSISAEGAYQLFAYHHAVDVSTTIDGVRRLFPGEVVEADATAQGPARIEITGANRYRYHPRATSEASTLDALVESLRNVVDRHRRIEHATVQLSGGLDSRLTVAALTQVTEARPEVTTLDLSDEGEVRIAQEVARRLGFPHRVIQIAEAGIEELRTGWLLTGGQVSAYAAAGNILQYERSEPGPEGEITIVGGWPGDCLIGSYIPVQRIMLSRFWVRAAASDWAHKRAAQWPELGVRISGNRARKIARASERALARRVRGASGNTAAQKISHWAMFCRQPAFSYVSPAILSSNVLAMTPLLAAPYLHKLLQLSARDIVSKNFYRKLVLAAAPHIADVASAATGIPISPDEKLPSWRPKNADEVYMRAPYWLLAAWRSIRRAPVVPPLLDTEAGHWSRVFDAAGFNGYWSHAGLTVDARGSGDVHVRSVAMTLQWTQEYLETARDALGPMRP